MPWARASSLDRHLVCPAASHLPQYDRGTWRPGYLGSFQAQQHQLENALLVQVDDRPTDAADWGTAMHAAKAGAADAVDPFVSMMEPYRLKLWPNDLGKHEVTVSFNCETRDYELFECPVEDERTKWKMATPDACVVGTADWWGTLPTGMPWIDDLKTGWASPDPMSSAMLFYLMLRMKYARDYEGYTDNLGQISITHWPRKAGKLDPETGEVDVGYPSRDGLWRKVPQIILDAFEDEVCEAWVRTKNNTYASPGGHCLYCPSASICDKANA